MKKIIVHLLFFLVLSQSIIAQITVSGSNGADGNYSSLTSATSGAFAQINSSSQLGRAIIITLSGNSTGETGAVALNAGLWTSFILYPTFPGLTISGNIDNPLINLNGADNIIFDGRLNATGSSIELTIVNTSTGTSASTILINNSAENNIFRFCDIKGSGTGTNRGTIFFSTAASGAGNNGNLIERNNISGNGLNRAINAIYSNGSSQRPNNDNIIQNNNIYNHLHSGLASNGIHLYNYCSDWVITGNSFFETSIFESTASVSYCFIRIRSYTGKNFTVSNNCMGGSTASCGGTAWTKTDAFDNEFTAIYLIVGNSSASNIQNNIIRNFNWSNSLNATWTGIQVTNGMVNIGTTTGNTIGSLTGTESIIINSRTNGNNVYGINLTGTGTVDCRNNSIGAISLTNNLGNASSFIGISNNSTSGTTIINNNTVGSSSVVNSINSLSTSSTGQQIVIGIANSGSGNIEIRNNTIANLTNGTTNNNPLIQGRINGIYSASGINVISENLIHDLTIGNMNNSSNQNVSNCGISLSGATYRNVSENTIYNLSNTNATFGGNVIGLYFSGNTDGNIISNNFIHSLSVSNSSTSASINGIRIFSGASTYSNNIINLNVNSLTTVSGIYENGDAGNNNNFYFNTVYLAGAPASGNNLSYALYSASTANIRNFRNNIFVNSRSTPGSSNIHYAIFFSSTGGSIICDYNDYFVSGTGGILGYFAGNKTSLPIVTGQDIHSVALDPLFSNAGGSLPADYQTTGALIGATGTGILVDYGFNNRLIPTIGAWEQLFSTWIGSTSDWNTASNWDGGIPSSSTHVLIPSNVITYPIISPGPDFTIGQSKVMVLEPGASVTFDNLTNNGILRLQSDATGISTLISSTFSGNNAEVQLYLTGGPGLYGPNWHYISSPFNTLSTDSITNTTSDLAQWVEPMASADLSVGWVAYDGFIYRVSTGDPPYAGPQFNSLTPGKGYNHYFADTHLYTLTGQLNTTTTAANLECTDPIEEVRYGLNLLGNPFSSGLDWDLISADPVYPLLTSKAIYFNRGGIIVYYNNGVGSDPSVTGTIPPMQGFFTKTYSQGNTITLSAAARTHSDMPVSRYKGAGESKGDLIPLVRMNILSGIYEDNAVVRFANDAKSGLDYDYDAEKLFLAATKPYIYSVSEETKFAINGLPFPEPTVEIPLVINISATGTHKITATQIQGLDNYPVMLIDTKAGSITDLKSNPVFTFTASAGLISDRFILKVGNISTGNEDPVGTEGMFKIYSSFENINIMTLSSDWDGRKGIVRILDLTGKVLSNYGNISFSRNSMITIPSTLTKGIYIIELKTGVRRYVDKIIIR